MSRLLEAITGMDRHDVGGGSGVLNTSASQIIWTERGGGGAVQLRNIAVPVTSLDGTISFMYEVPKGTFYVTPGASVELREGDTQFTTWRWLIAG